MPEIVERQRIRFAGDSTSFETPKNVRSGRDASIKLWSGSAAQFEVGHFLGTSLAAISNFTHVVLQIKNGPDAPVPETAYLAQKIVEAADFDDTLDETTWGDFSKQHFLFEFSDEEMAQVGTKWLILYAVTIAGNTVTLAAGSIEFKQDGGPSVTAPDPVAENGWTKSEADARFTLKTDFPLVLVASAAEVTGEGKYFIGDAGTLVLWDPAANSGAGARLILQGTYDF